MMFHVHSLNPKPQNRFPKPFGFRVKRLQNAAPRVAVGCPPNGRDPHPQRRLYRFKV